MQAVGASSPDRSFAVAERWDGHRWRVEPTPDIRGARSVELLSVSCPTAASCTAVGDVSTKKDTFATPIAEHWNGTVWRLQPLPRRAPQLLALSCVSVRFCVAVGGFEEDGLVSQSDAVTWNGASWRRSELPALANSDMPELSAISCSPGRVCTAVGTVANFYGVTHGLVPDRTLVEHLGVGGKWHRSASPSPTTQSFLDGVDCPTGRRCVAVGIDYTGRNFRRERVLAEGTGGGAWTRRPIVAPAGSYLSAVSCRSRIQCVAVGASFKTGSQESAPLIESGSGRSWHPVALPTVKAEKRGLDAVACPAPGACIAVGYRGTNRLLSLRN